MNEKAGTNMKNREVNGSNMGKPEAEQPEFFAAFLQDRKLTREEAEKIAEMIRKAVE